MTAITLVPFRPAKVNICGIEYSIEYTDNPANVDLYKRKALWGEIDYWTQSIRVYDNGKNNHQIWQTLIHEILHGIAENLKLSCLQNKDNHDDLDVLALALWDVFTRNGWFSFGERP